MDETKNCFEIQKNFTLSEAGCSTFRHMSPRNGPPLSNFPRAVDGSVLGCQVARVTLLARLRLQRSLSSNATCSLFFYLFIEVSPQRTNGHKLFDAWTISHSVAKKSRIISALGRNGRRARARTFSEPGPGVGAGRPPAPGGPWRGRLLSGHVVHRGCPGRDDSCQGLWEGGWHGPQHRLDGPFVVVFLPPMPRCSPGVRGPPEFFLVCGLVLWEHKERGWASG